MIHELSGLEWSDLANVSPWCVSGTEGEAVGSSLHTVQHVLEFNCGRLLHSFKHVLVGVARKSDRVVSVRNSIDTVAVWGSNPHAPTILCQSVYRTPNKISTVNWSRRS